MTKYLDPDIEEGESMQVEEAGMAEGDIRDDPGELSS